MTMKVLRRQISSKDGDGFVQMKTEEAEDMWHAYNLIAAGDRVRTSTVRKVRCEFAVSCYQDARSKIRLNLNPQHWRTGSLPLSLSLGCTTTAVSLSVAASATEDNSKIAVAALFEQGIEGTTGYCCRCTPLVCACDGLIGKRWRTTRRPGIGWVQLLLATCDKACVIAYNNF